jgi:FkbM family methyltransferase
MRSSARHFLRTLGLKFPQLSKFSGRLGLGRLVAPSNSHEQITIDGDVRIEFDMSVPIFRYIYFHYDFAASPEINIMRALLKPDETCIDVGAHLGYLSLIAAKYSKHVIAFEPSPTTFQLLKRNIELNPSLSTKIRAEEYGLSNHEGSFTLYTSKTHPDLASLEPIEVPDGFTQEIKLTTLDQSVSIEDSPVGFIKIDVEGAELNVLEGGKDLIKRHHPIIMLELIESHQQRFSHSCGEVVTLLASQGYEAYLIPNSDARLQRLNLSELSSTEVNNALFVHTEMTDRLTVLTSNRHV